jgi:hypothetical protein
VVGRVGLPALELAHLEWAAKAREGGIEVLLELPHIEPMGLPHLLRAGEAGLEIEGLAGAHGVYRSLSRPTGTSVYCPECDSPNPASSPSTIRT